jgi:hypothetical protein
VLCASFASNRFLYAKSYFLSLLYIERLEAAFERTTLKNALLQKENAEYKELLRVCKKRKTGKRVAIKGRFVFQTTKILELVEEARVEASKGKSKKRRIIRASTPEIEYEEEESSEGNTYESEGDCIIVASSRSNVR